MIIVQNSDVRAEESTGEMVAQGKVYRKLLISQEMAGGGLQFAEVSFEPGARLASHVHDFEQVIYVTEGTGILATETEEHVVKAGDVVFIPPGEVHWHGATKDASFAHVAAFKGGSKVV